MGAVFKHTARALEFDPLTLTHGQVILKPIARRHRGTAPHKWVGAQDGDSVSLVAQVL
jgi:hypothetical protein